jgi:hypothetical protein
MEISWTDDVRNKEVIKRGKEERNILQKIQRRKAKLTGHILDRNSLIKHVIGGEIKGRKK